jgi:hypothetical protein
LLVRADSRGYFARMLRPTLTPATKAARPTWPRRVAVQILRLVLVGVLMGWLYAWAAPVVYPKETVPGFWFGAAHGALMPMALPSLLMGKEVPIYAIENRGNIYKIGYIAGING